MNDAWFYNAGVRSPSLECHKFRFWYMSFSETKQVFQKDLKVLLKKFVSGIGCVQCFLNSHFLRELLTLDEVHAEMSQVF